MMRRLLLRLDGSAADRLDGEYWATLVASLEADGFVVAMHAALGDSEIDDAVCGRLLLDGEYWATLVASLEADGFDAAMHAALGDSENDDAVCGRLPRDDHECRENWPDSGGEPAWTCILNKFLRTMGKKQIQRKGLSYSVNYFFNTLADDDI